MGVHSILEQRDNKNKTLFGGIMSETKLLSYVPFISSSFELNEIRKEFDVNKIFNLRKGQAEAFFAMLSSVENDSRKILVLPTGTGKTDLMIALFCFGIFKGRLLIVVPSDGLRTQLAERFANVGCLREKGILPQKKFDLRVATLNPKTRSEDWLDIVLCSDVVIVTPNIVKKRIEYFKTIAPFFSHVFVDEGHHTEAPTWKGILDFFLPKNIVLFTATPYRSDKQRIQGKIVYSYSLRRAQKDGVYSKIELSSIYQLVSAEADKSIAKEALRILACDRAKGFTHKILARCNSKDRAEELKLIYQKEAPTLSIESVHSGKKKKSPKEIKSLDVIICVDMMGEGIDIPEFKIAAIHDSKKSLAPLLQFIGRFARTNPLPGEKLGNATVVLNRAEERQTELLKDLYEEDSDWNNIIPNLSDVALMTETTDRSFYGNFEVPINNSDFSLDLALFNIPFKYHIFTYQKKFDKKTLKKKVLDYCYDNDCLCAFQDDRNVVVLASITREPSDWTSQQSMDTFFWDISVIHWFSIQSSSKSQLLCIANSTKNPSINQIFLKKLLGEDLEIYEGDRLFNIFTLLEWPVGTNVGGSRKEYETTSYQTIAAKDISRIQSPQEEASFSETCGTLYGKLGDSFTSVGVSKNGKVWTTRKGSINNWVEFVETTCRRVFDKRLKETFILRNSIKSIVQTSFPKDTQPFTVELDSSLYSKDQIIIKSSKHGNFSSFDAELQLCQQTNRFKLQLSGKEAGEFEIQLGGTEKSPTFKIIADLPKGEKLTFVSKGGKHPMDATQFFKAYPPNFLFPDGSLLRKNQFVKYNQETPSYPIQDLQVLDWSGCDISNESQWKEGVFRTDSIQYHFIENIKKGSFELIFDDDNAGEIADVVAIERRKNKEIHIYFYHLKYSTNGAITSGNLGQFNEVCSQALRSRRWTSKFTRALFLRMLKRAGSVNKSNPASNRSRFILGNEKLLSEIAEATNKYPVYFHIGIVQPGLSKEKAMTNGQNNVFNLLGSVSEIIRNCTGSKLEVFCSA